MPVKSKLFLMRGRQALLYTLPCLLPLFCYSQQSRLTVQTPAQLDAKRGVSVDQALAVNVLPGFHVNNDKPKDEFLIPLKLTWTGGPLEVESVTYPKPEEIKVGSQMLTVFTGNFQIKTQFHVPGNAPAGSAVMLGKLRYQACNNEMCFRPASVEIKLPVAIE